MSENNEVKYEDMVTALVKPGADILANWTVRFDS